jgi:hypothetical protein
MPLYPTLPLLSPPSVGRGMDVVIVNNEQLGVGNNSQRAAITPIPGAPPCPVTVTFAYATVPASVQYDIYVAWDDSLGFAGYTKIGTTNNVNGDQVTIQRAVAGGLNFRLLLVKEVIPPGVAATVIVRQ